MAGLELQEALNLDQIQRTTADYSEATGLASVVVEARGAPVTSPCAFTEFCRVVRMDPIRSKLCEGCDSLGGLQSLIEKTPRIYRCHAGLVDFSVPIIVGDVYVGAIASGQVRVTDSEQPDFLITQIPWEVDSHLEQLYNEVPVYSRSRIIAAAETLLGLSRSPSIVRDCLLVNLPPRRPLGQQPQSVGQSLPDTQDIKSAQSMPGSKNPIDDSNLHNALPLAEMQVPLLRHSLSQDVAPIEPMHEHRIVLRDLLNAEDLATAFEKMSDLLDEAFSAQGDLRDHVAALEDLVMAVAGDCAPRVASHVTHIVHSNRGRRTSSSNRYQSQLYMERLLTIILDDVVRSRPQRPADLQDLLNEIAQHPNRPRSLAEASAALHWSPGHLSKLFKSVTGCTFVSYITARRIARAKLMLAHTQTPVRKIAAALGFDQVNYFSRVFRAHIGMSPNEYRRQHSSREVDQAKPGTDQPTTDQPTIDQPATDQLKGAPSKAGVAEVGVAEFDVAEPDMNK